MNETSEFGNIGWQAYVWSAYAAVIIALFGYALYAIRNRAASLRSLKDEGYLSEPGTGVEEAK